MGEERKMKEYRAELDAEREEMAKGTFFLVDGLLTPAVLAHIARYKLYVD